jgi:hypothetical protein
MKTLKITKRTYYSKSQFIDQWKSVASFLMSSYALSRHQSPYKIENLNPLGKENVSAYPSLEFKFNLLFNDIVLWFVKEPLFLNAVC